MKTKHFLSLVLITAISLFGIKTMKGQCHVYTDSLITIGHVTSSADTTFISVGFLVVESPNKYPLINAQGRITYQYPSTQSMTDNQKMAAIKAQVDAWINQHYAPW